MVLIYEDFVLSVFCRSYCLNPLLGKPNSNKGIHSKLVAGWMVVLWYIGIIIMEFNCTALVKRKVVTSVTESD